MEHLADALSACDRAQASLARSDWSAAARAFEEASRAHPESAALHDWQAHALAQGGDVAGARAVLDAAIPFFTGNIDLRYNRAAYAAQDGDLEAAASTGYGAPEAVEEYVYDDSVIESRESADGYGAPGATDEYVDY